MDNREAVLDALKDFSNKPTPNIPPLLEDYLRNVAKNGETVFPWTMLKPLLLEKVRTEMTRFHEEMPFDDSAAIPNVENIKFQELKERIIRRLNAFNGAPFTIQRLCELMTDPKKHYRRSDKFLRGIERNVSVVSTVDPFGSELDIVERRVISGGEMHWRRIGENERERYFTEKEILSSFSKRRKIVSESKHLMNGITDHSLPDTPKAKRLPPPPPCTPTHQYYLEPPASAFNSPNVKLEAAPVENSIEPLDKTTSMLDKAVMPGVSAIVNVEKLMHETASISHGTIAGVVMNYNNSSMPTNHAVYMDLPPVDHNTEASLVTTDSPSMALSPSACYTNLETMERVSSETDSVTQPSNLQLLTNISAQRLPQRLLSEPPTKFLSEFHADQSSYASVDTISCDTAQNDGLIVKNYNSSQADQPLQFRVTNSATIMPTSVATVATSSHTESVNEAADGTHLARISVKQPTSPNITDDHTDPKGNCVNICTLNTAPFPTHQALLPSSPNSTHASSNKAAGTPLSSASADDSPKSVSTKGLAIAAYNSMAVPNPLKSSTGTPSVDAPVNKELLPIEVSEPALSKTDVEYAPSQEILDDGSTKAVPTDHEPMDQQ